MDPINLISYFYEAQSLVSFFLLWEESAGIKRWWGSPPPPRLCSMGRKTKESGMRARVKGIRRSVLVCMTQGHSPTCPPPVCIRSLCTIPREASQESARASSREKKTQSKVIVLTCTVSFIYAWAAVSFPGNSDSFPAIKVACAHPLRRE